MRYLSRTPPSVRVLIPQFGSLKKNSLPPKVKSISSGISLEDFLVDVVDMVELSNPIGAFDQ